MEARATTDPISFGPFTLLASERLLTNNGAPVALGARTLDTLIALVARPNQVISKRDLLAHIWPDVIVEEASLRFHIAGLRKALGDGKDGARYIATLAGRGYCFVAPIRRADDGPPIRRADDGPPIRRADNGLPIRRADDGPPIAPVGEPAPPPAERPRGNLPNRLLRMVGRDAIVLKLSADLLATRFVTIVGPGGVGKTTVAVAVADALAESFAGAVLFADLGALRDRALAAAALASMLGLAAPSNDPLPGLIGYLRDKRILLILDTCEHLIEAVAPLAACLLAAGPQVHILATSREAMRIEGEHVLRLPPLALAPEDPTLSATERLSFPATELFVERARASGSSLDLDDANTALIATICRKLDGIPLAIELAAGRVEAFGLQQTATLLEQRLALPWQGQRTAPPRQRTLQATLDWSFGLLSEHERGVLLQLAVFIGHFTLEAALAVVNRPAADQSLVVGVIDSLVAKSMLAVRPAGAMMRYGLLDTTRAYAIGFAADPAELDGVASRHAVYYLRWLEQIESDWPILSSASERAPHFAGLHNVRAALQWCFDGGDAKLGIALACAAAPVFLAMSFVDECYRWSERAILALDDESRGRGEEMRLQASLGTALMLIRGSSDAVRVALDRSLAIAEDLGDILTQLKLLGPLRMYHSRLGSFRTALHYAERSATLACTLADPVAMAFAHSMLGNSLYIAGELTRARAELEAALAPDRGAERAGTTFFGFNGYNLAETTLAQIVWLQGDPSEAEQRARKSVANAARTDHPVTLSVALVWAIAVFLGTCHLESAREYVDWFIANAEAHSLRPYLAVGRGFRGQLAICSGDLAGGVLCLEDCLQQLHALHYELLTTPFNLSLAQGLAATGRHPQALALIETSIQRVELQGDLIYLPELLRVQASILLAMQSQNEAEACLSRSLALSRRQASRAWELRAALDWAAIMAADRRQGDAITLLRAVLHHFAPRADTADLRAAERLLARLGGQRRTMPGSATPDDDP